MSSAGRCIARSTSSGMVVGPGIARNSRPARTTIFLVPCGDAPAEGCRGMAGNSSYNMMIISSLRATGPRGYNFLRRPGLEPGPIATSANCYKGNYLPALLIGRGVWVPAQGRDDVISDYATT